MQFNDIDSWRAVHLAIAEWIDAWRMVPRLLTAGFGVLLWKASSWYMSLETTMVESCPVELLGVACIEAAPSTQHAVILTVLMGAATAIFGLYTSSGRKWNGFTPWNKKPTDSISE